eukprot:359852-Chlamydomonas_euryale.AAC.3
MPRNSGIDGWTDGRMDGRMCAPSRLASCEGRTRQDELYRARLRRAVLAVRMQRCHDGRRDALPYRRQRAVWERRRDAPSEHQRLGVWNVVVRWESQQREEGSVERGDHQQGEEHSAGGEERSPASCRKVNAGRSAGLACRKGAPPRPTRGRQGKVGTRGEGRDTRGREEGKVGEEVQREKQGIMKEGKANTGAGDHGRGEGGYSQRKVGREGGQEEEGKVREEVQREKGAGDHERGKGRYSGSTFASTFVGKVLAQQAGMMDGWTDRQANGQTEGRNGICTFAYKDGYAGGWWAGSMDGHMTGWLADWQVNGWTHDWMAG